jgi:guanylate kinase
MRLENIRSRREGILFILSAPSGAGKTTLVHRLMRIFPDIKLSVSCTTRRPRAGEVPGRDYRFVTAARFLATRNRRGFAEWARVHGSFYGTPKAPLLRAIRNGRDLLLDIDVQGARQIKKAFPRAVLIFILPPSWRELAHRLAWRRMDHKTTRERLRAARRELKEIMRYDYLVVNREVRRAADCLKAIVIAERQKVARYRSGGI